MRKCNFGFAIRFFCLAFFVIIGCVPGKEAQWRYIEVSKEAKYEQIFYCVKDVLLERGFEMATIESDAGYLKTTWKMKEQGDFWATTNRERVEISLKKSPPYDLKVKAEVWSYQRGCCFLPYFSLPTEEEKWTKCGNDFILEEEIMREINKRLR